MGREVFPSTERPKGEAAVNDFLIVPLTVA